MAKEFDLVAIGTGSAASTVAWACKSAGWQVAVVDKRPFGGTCALRGCDPKKVLVGAAEIADWARRMGGDGIRSDGLRIDWPELMRFKRTFTDPVPENRLANFTKGGIATFRAPARFVNANSVRVGDEVLEAKHVLIATGMRPGDLGIPGAEHITTSDQFLELDRLPERIAFIGGGYISFEFAHVAARAGSKVTIVHRGRRPLAGFDPDLVDLLIEATRHAGVEVLLEAKVEAVEETSNGLRLRTSRSVLDADLIVHGAGRVPDIDDLNLESAGVEHDKRGVRVNEFLQSVSNPSVYSAGDAAGSGTPPLTPVAGYEGQVVAANLLKGNHRKSEPGAVPSVVFTVPPLASTGLHELAAKSRGIRFRRNYQATSGWYASRRIGERHSGFKVLIDEDSDRIIGAHILGHNAEELINIFTIAIQAGIRTRELKEMIFAYPTHGSNIRYML